VVYTKKVEGREFTFKLALKLGKTVEELENTMTFQEYQEWQEYISINPFDEDITELQLAMIGLLNSNSKHAKVSDFMISNKKQKPQKITNSQVHSFFNNI